MDGSFNETVVHHVMNGTMTGNATFLRIIDLNWVEIHRGYTLFYALICCLIAVFVSLYTISEHFAHYTCPKVQRYIIRILLIVPVYSLASFLSLKFLTHALYFDTMRDCYEAFVVYSFLSLVIYFAGGESACVAKMKMFAPSVTVPNVSESTTTTGTTATPIQRSTSICNMIPATERELDMPHPWPFNYCFSAMGRDARLLRMCKRGVIQFIVVKPLFAFLSLFLLFIGQYHSLLYQWTLAIVYNISYSIALYCLVLFYMAMRHALEKLQPVLKFFAVKLIIFVTFWQQYVLENLPGITVEQYIVWKDLILCVEMVCFSILYYFAFGSKQFRTTFEKIPPETVVKNIKEVLSINDIVADAYHNFMPSYQDYTLQRSEDEFPEKYRAKTFIVGNLGDVPSTSSVDSTTVLDEESRISEKRNDTLRQRSHSESEKNSLPDLISFNINDAPTENSNDQKMTRSLSSMVKKVMNRWIFKAEEIKDDDSSECNDTADSTRHLHGSMPTP